MFVLKTNEKTGSPPRFNFKEEKKKKKTLNRPDLSKDEIYSGPTNTKNKTNLIQIKGGK